MGKWPHGVIIHGLWAITKKAWSEIVPLGLCDRTDPHFAWLTKHCGRDIITTRAGGSVGGGGGGGNFEVNKPPDKNTNAVWWYFYRSQSKTKKRGRNEPLTLQRTGCTHCILPHTKMWMLYPHFQGHSFRTRELTKGQGGGWRIEGNRNSAANGTLCQINAPATVFLLFNYI